MKNIFNKIDEDKIIMSNDIDFQINTNKVKELTMNKIRNEPNITFSKKIIGMVASLLFVVTLTGAATYAFAGPVLRSYIQEILGLEVGEVLLVGETISNKHYSMTVEDFVYDGARGEVTLSVSAISDTAKETFKTDKIHDKFGHFSIGCGIGEIDMYQEEYKRFFSISFSTLLGKYEYLKDLDHLIFAFEGMRDMVSIPLEPTLSSEQKDISVSAQGYYPVEYHSIVYSKLGFTLIGKQVNEIEDFENITIDFVLKNGDTINLVNEINYNYKLHNGKPNVSSENQKSHKETIIMDGKEIEVDVAENELVNDNSIIEGVDFIHETNDDWFAGSSSGYNTDNKMFEKSFTFTKSFDWEIVDKMIINTTEVSLD